MDEAVYGLSDSAKAFAIILFTDIFVGYHSPEGWSVLLDGIADHFGLPSSESFVNPLLRPSRRLGDDFQVLDLDISTVFRLRRLRP